MEIHGVYFKAVNNVTRLMRIDYFKQFCKFFFFKFLFDRGMNIRTASSYSTNNCDFMSKTTKNNNCF